MDNFYVSGWLAGYSSVSAVQVWSREVEQPTLFFLFFPGGTPNLPTGTELWKKGKIKVKEAVLHLTLTTGCDSLSLSSALSSKVPRRLQCASLRSSWSSASAICQTSSTVSSMTLLPHLWDPCIFCH